MGKRVHDEFENSLMHLAALTALREVALCTSLIVLVAALAIGFGSFGKDTVQLAVASAKTAPVTETVSESAEENAETGQQKTDEPDGKSLLECSFSTALPIIAEKTDFYFDHGKTLLRDDFYLECVSRGTSQALVDAGGIVEYYPALYCSHSYDEGAIFFNFDPGDVVHIDGMDVTIEGCGYFNYWHDTVYGVRDQLGDDSILFQTCLDESSSGDVVIYYGHAV